MGKHTEKGDSKLKLSVTERGCSKVTMDPNLYHIWELGKNEHKGSKSLPAQIAVELEKIRGTWDSVSQLVYRFWCTSAKNSSKNESSGTNFMYSWLV
jgi:hypothetical protein